MADESGDDDDPEVLERHQDDNAWEEAVAAAEDERTLEEMEQIEEMIE